MFRTEARLAYSPATRLDELNTAELFVVSAFRLWMLPNLDSGRCYPDWRGAFRRGRLDVEAAEAFDLLCRIIASTGFRALDIHSLGCRRLGTDEAWLLRALSLLQRNHVAEAEHILLGWCPPGAARAALMPARAFGSALGLNNLWLPSCCPLRNASACASPVRIH